MAERDLERLSIDTLRGLAMDMVEQAGVGHTGTAMALAPLGYAIFRRLRANPQDPQWAGRDRFVLSSGHACVLQYALLHLTGYDLSLEDLRQFRQWESARCSGSARGFLRVIRMHTLNGLHAGLAEDSQ